MQMYVDGASVCRYLQFSGIAIAVAHEITHGFDDEGYSRMSIKFKARLHQIHVACSRIQVSRTSNLYPSTCRRIQVSQTE